MPRAKKPATAVKGKPGRPTLYTDKLATEICNRIADGEPLRQICRQPGFPDYTVVYDWLNKYPDFSQRFAQARVLGYDAIAEEAFAIADDGRNDWMERNSENSPGWVLNGEHVQRSKLRIETRLKLLAKWDPKRYGDRLQAEIEHSGSVDVGVSIEQARAIAEEFRKLNET